MVQDKVETLACLGLTALQAKIYLFLTSCEARTIREISQGSSVARTEIFRVINELQDLSLVEKILSYPSQYRAVPLPVGVQILLERKEKENTELHRKATNLIEQCVNENEKESDRGKLNPQFVLLPKGEIGRYKFRFAFSHAQTKVDSIVPWKTLLQSNVKAFKRVMKRKVVIRYIINRPEDKNLVAKFIRDQDLNSQKLFNVKFTDKLPEVVFRIIDTKEAFISTIEGCNPIEQKTPVLWSSNPCLIIIVQKYFDSIWDELPKEL